ncbi:MAG TPA: hypothetical protein VHA33_08055 [Candidatus Angelobacter sp.]|jgi:hypothetical protein|nr:hypothetical protein [Candidatus Angelobacter sp.]
MKVKTFIALALICVISLSGQSPKGTVPRATADRYPAHSEQSGVGVGVTLLTPDQVHNAFASDVNKCCIVVEVALYPPKDSTVSVALKDFVLRVAGSDIAARPSEAKVLAAKLQKKATSQDRDVTISPNVGVGYDSGGYYDPVTGQRRAGGVYTSTGVGVGVGGSRPQPGSTDVDRNTMELELNEKGLPEGEVATPVAGYLYFALPQKKDKPKDKKAVTHELEYNLHGNKIVLPLP